MLILTNASLKYAVDVCLEKKSKIIIVVENSFWTRYGLGEWAKGRYEAETKASACIECGACEGRCPYHLPIREMMKRVAREFEG